MIEQLIGTASNLRIEDNPPYALADFLEAYPQFFGTEVSFTGNVVAGSPVIEITTMAPPVLYRRALIMADGFSNGLIVSSYLPATDEDRARVTVDAAFPSAGTDLSFSAYVTLAPVSVIRSTIAVALASINKGRWQELWETSVGLYAAHLLTMHITGTVPVGATGRAVSTAGTAHGSIASESAGDVSVSYQRLDELSGWGNLQLTAFGQQLATYGKLVSMGGSYVW